MTTHPAFKVSWAAYACLFASGAASLVYELIWFRHLVLVFGASLYALSAVLCAFMMGLAGGAWVMGRVLSRAGNELDPEKLIRGYGLLEGLIGLYALFFPLGLSFLETLYPLILPASGQVGWGVHLLEFLLSTLLMLPATLLMGATLPLVGCWATGNQKQNVFTQVSRLYGVNTFGAVFGCLFAQFLAIRLWGVQGATGVAVGLNAVVFILCLSRPKIFYAADSSSSPIKVKPNKNKKKQESEVSPSISFLVFIMFFYSGLVSLSSEILWTRILVFPLGSTLYSFALILATFLLGIAIGSLTANKLLGQSHRVLKFVSIEIAIGVFCIAILPVLSNLTEWTALADQYFYSLDPSPGKTFLIRALFAFGLMFIPTFGFGLLFPLANHIYSYRFQGVGKILGNTYSINTVGAVLGTILTPFVFIPLLGIRLSLYVIYAVLILFGLYILGRVRECRSSSMVMMLGGVFIILVLGKTYWVPEIETQKAGQGNFARLEVNVPAERIRLLDYKEGEYSTISVVEDKESRARTIYLDGFSTATVSSAFSGSTYMQAMGFVPMALHPSPKRVLVIGFGTGNTMGTASLFPGAEVHGVEIDKNVLEFSKWFAQWNHDVLNRPNTKMFIQDGRAFLKWSQSTYDVIIMEPMSPLQAGVVNLYSREFYELALSHLKEDGLLVQWLPLHLIGPEDARSITHTFQQVFPEFSVWNSFLTRIVMLVGSRKPVTLDKNHFETLMDSPELKKMAVEMKVNSFLDFADFFITEGKRLSPFLKGAGEITDDAPLLEFSSVSLLPPLQWETDESFLNLLRPRLDQFPGVTGMSTQELDAFKKKYTVRTAQRFGLFARRYQGPGENFFASGNYFGGLEALRVYFDSNAKPQIHLQGAKWDD
ncbi:MAG: fused MFS/spermidine synthase [Nitrospina sp.]|jgi:spermidine synthase|nr:fused MFS/spermidine synthase [Nitrospina sp.]